MVSIASLSDQTVVILTTLCNSLTTGTPKGPAYTAICTEETTPVDKIDYLKDQLSVVCAEVAAQQLKALAATDELDQELETGTPGNRLVMYNAISVVINPYFGTLLFSQHCRLPFSPRSGAPPPSRTSFSGSAVSTSTLDSSAGINAAAPHHIKQHSRASSPAPSAVTASAQEEGKCCDYHVPVIH